jgi:acylphosphatase
MLAMAVARRFLVSGRVQGVGFRYFTEDRALEEGLHGYVRNLPDGRVEIVAEGEADALERFERAVQGGPAAARVEACDVTDLTPTGQTSGFTIRL